jgi:hypothetical protein
VREAGLMKNLEKAAAALRKQAAAVAAQVEKYAHEVRMELLKTSKQSKPAKKARKRVAKKRAVAGVS